MSAARGLDTELAQLREANAMLSRFAGQAAHDIQEPLRLIAGYLDLLVAHQEGRLEVDAGKLTREARDATRRAQEMVASLLELARARTVKLDARPAPLEKALDDALGNLRLRLSESGARVTHDALPTLRGEPPQLARLFQNLVENAIKYAPAGQHAHVHVSARDEGKEWLVVVEDDGPGFPDRGRERLFEPFARLHDETTPGAGLGLAMVRTIVERHGGTVRATDAASGGARIEMRFPKGDSP